MYKSLSAVELVAFMDGLDTENSVLCTLSEVLQGDPNLTMYTNSRSLYGSYASLAIST